MRNLSLFALSAGLVGCIIVPNDDDPKDSGITTVETGTMTTMDDPFVFDADPPTAYARVDRMGMPAVATAVIASKDAYNAADPVDDAAGTFVGEIVASVQFLHSALDDDLYALGLSPCGGSPTEPAIGQCIDQAAPFVVPDTLTIDTSGVAGFPNGRALPDPVIDVTLALVLLDLSVHDVGLFAGLPLNPPANDVAFPPNFPYLADAQ
jgi:hypothetical protein